ncbi:Remorin 4.1, partial [Mucuna pruriens]
LPRGLATNSDSVMKKSSGSSQKLGSFLSPGAPNYREQSLGSQKGWSSERVLLQPSSSSIRHASVANLTPFNSGRTIPSKWDDAERWICSPVSGYATNKTSSYAQLQRRPKSKSGPIVPPGTGFYSNFSPTIPLRQGLVVKNFMMGSPFSTGVLAPDAISLHHYYAHDAVYGARYDFDNSMQCDNSPVLNENSVALPSVSSAPLWSELLFDPSSPISQDETKNEETVSSPIPKCDKGTQMSPPETENDDAPKSSPSWSMDRQNAKLEVRDVEVDSEATIIRWSKSKSYVPKLSLLPGKDMRKSSSTEAQASDLDIAESSTSDISKFQREEAKIIAWESLQKAKAEAAIRKLEMKLEKKKSSSMDKIVNKLRRAQMKAEKMRSLITVQQDQQVPKTRKVFSFHKYAQIWSPRSCFTTHAP